MRTPVILSFVGRFLKIYSGMLALPILVAAYYSESSFVMLGFVIASVSCVLMGFVLEKAGEKAEPTTMEALFATVLGWILAIGFGAVPLMGFLGLVDAFFESAAGLTTTGISMFLEPEVLPNSILFWRSFMQWIGGLGILTFFVAVIRESGGVSNRLFSAEAHKTDAGSIRPSLTKSIAALWKVYGFLTAVIIGVYLALGMSVFDSFIHAFSVISTGGFSTMSASIGGFESVSIESATVLFMFIGGVNFVLLYRFLRSDFRSLVRSSEFRLYTLIFILISAVASIDLLKKGFIPGEAILNGFFQSAALVSSTGYSNMSIATFSLVLQTVFIAVMFFGGSLGSTSGGFKVFRLKTLMELFRVRIRAYSLPESAINEVKIDGEILERSAVRTISVLFFLWVAFTFSIALVTVGFEQVTFIEAVSGSVSSLGNMGPVYLTGEELVGMSPVVKVVWVIGMLAGRLELLPLLAIFNRDLFKDSS